MGGGAKVAAAEGDPAAVIAVERYQKRPAEELYDCELDPWNRYNLADDPAYAGVKQRLAGELAGWMISQGDEGQPTEIAGYQRLWRDTRNHGES